MDNLKFLKENISELQRLTKSVLTHSYDNLQKDEILKFMSLYEIILFININTNVKKCNTSEEFIFINIYMTIMKKSKAISKKKLRLPFQSYTMIFQCIILMNIQKPNL